MIGKQEDGGVGLVELKFKALKAAWSKLFVNKDCVVSHVVESNLDRFQVDINYISLSETKSSKKTMIARLPILYQEILCSYNESKRQKQQEKIIKI